MSIKIFKKILIFVYLVKCCELKSKKPIVIYEQQ